MIRGGGGRSSRVVHGTDCEKKIYENQKDPRYAPCLGNLKKNNANQNLKFWSHSCWFLKEQNIRSTLLDLNP